MASSTNRGPGQSTGMYGASCSTAPTQGQRLESSGASGGGMSGLMDKAQELASNLGTKAEDAWDSTRHGVQRAASTVAGTAEDAFASATECMRRYPIATLCAGFGVGFLIGRLVAQRGRLDFFRGGSRYNWWDEDARQARTFGRYEPSDWGR